MDRKGSSSLHRCDRQRLIGDLCSGGYFLVVCKLRHHQGLPSNRRRSVITDYKYKVYKPVSLTSLAWTMTSTEYLTFQRQKSKQTKFQVHSIGIWSVASFSCWLLNGSSSEALEHFAGRHWPGQSVHGRGTGRVQQVLAGLQTSEYFRLQRTYRTCSTCSKDRSSIDFMSRVTRKQFLYVR